MLSIILSLNLFLAVSPAVRVEIGWLFPEVIGVGEVDVQGRVEAAAFAQTDAEEFLIRGNHSVNRYLEIRAARP